jgi:methionyl-tRNA synthetase
VVQADTLARLYRQQGYAVRLQAGTDENSIKNVHAAEAAGIPVAELVERNAARFLALKTKLNLSYDDFIRTSTDARHRRGVERLWQACFERGDIYKRSYSGLYCTGCEQFYKIAELDEGRCPEHGTKLELIEEENWFFDSRDTKTRCTSFILAARLRSSLRRGATKCSRGSTAALRISASRAPPLVREAGAYLSRATPIR